MFLVHILRLVPIHLTSCWKGGNLQDPGHWGGWYETLNRKCRIHQHHVALYSTPPTCHWVSHGQRGAKWDLPKRVLRKIKLQKFNTDQPARHGCLLFSPWVGLMFCLFRILGSSSSVYVTVSNEISL